MTVYGSIGGSGSVIIIIVIPQRFLLILSSLVPENNLIQHPKVRCCGNGRICRVRGWSVCRGGR